MARPLFCHLGPWAYRLAKEKGILLRHLRDCCSAVRFCRSKSAEPLPACVFRHASPLHRRLAGTDPQLQLNKAHNLALAAPQVSGILIRPGETFSFWRLVGRDTAAKGYKPGLYIKNGKPAQAIGGGMCQFSNLIHWLVLHSDLTITEHHHHEGRDLFPDCARSVPFGTGTSIAYNYLDYRFRNDTDNTYQLLISVTPTELCGELRAAQPQPSSYRIYTENERFVEEAGKTYRTGEVYRDRLNADGMVAEHTLLRRNHAEVMYELPATDGTDHER